MALVASCGCRWDLNGGNGEPCQDHRGGMPHIKSVPTRPISAILAEQRVYENQRSADFAKLFRRYEQQKADLLEAIVSTRRDYYVHAEALEALDATRRDMDAVDIG